MTPTARRYTKALVGRFPRFGRGLRVLPNGDFEAFVRAPQRLQRRGARLHEPWDGRTNGRARRSSEVATDPPSVPARAPASSPGLGSTIAGFGPPSDALGAEELRHDMRRE
jgi:hypothetical protein